MILSAGPRQVVFTANSDTPYGSGTFDLKDRAARRRIATGAVYRLADDHHQRWIMDMGLPGPDAGKGGKYLMLPPGYKGEVPAGYYVGRVTDHTRCSSPSARCRSKATSTRRWPRCVPSRFIRCRARPLSRNCVKFIDITRKPMDGTCLRWEDNIQFWGEAA